MKLILKQNDASSKKIQEKRAFRKKKSKEKLLRKRKNIPKLGMRGTCHIDVPIAMHIDSPKNRRGVLNFFKEIRQKSLIENLKIVLDFSRCEFISAPAMLLFIAEVDRIKHIMGKEFDLYLSHIKNKNVKQVLVQIGFFELCDQIPPKLERSAFADNVKHWHFASGERVDDDTNEAFGAIQGRISPEAQKGMWRGLSEALINSVQHAYVAPRGTKGPDMNVKRWWMFTQERNDKLTVAVCDLGVGIPRSLPLNWSETFLAQIRSALGLAGGADVDAVKTALRVGESSTGLKHRGRGLPQVWRAIRGDSGTGILIHSNKARLAWNSDDDREFSHEFGDSIHGTLVMWTVKTKPESSL